MTERKFPQAEANRLSKMLNQVLGPDRFPVNVEELALDYSRQCFPKFPITTIQGDNLPGFEGMLVEKSDKTQWKIIYNSGVRSEGRIRFTLAHEFGHYLLHRDAKSEFNCSQRDMDDWEAQGREMETEADLFASYLLMPLDDYRRQIADEPVSFDLLSHCADRYGVSLTAAALKWIEIAPKRAVLVASRDDHLLWARPNSAAFRSGAVFSTRKRTFPVPPASVAYSGNRSAVCQEAKIHARVWFPREPEDMPLTEMTLVSDQYDYTLTLLLMPDAAWQLKRHDNGEAIEDTVDFLHRLNQRSMH